jgi:hypothetical protein
MGRQLAVGGLAVLCALSVLVCATGRSAPFVMAEDEQGAIKAPSPAEGYTVHVLAPHLVDGHQMGPYHHYCKVLAPDPVIQCGPPFAGGVHRSQEANPQPGHAEGLECELA